MSKIIYIPLEELPQRYTQMMNNAIRPWVEVELYPEIEIDTQIKRGQFLDMIYSFQVLNLLNIWPNCKILM